MSLEIVGAGKAAQDKTAQPATPDTKKNVRLLARVLKLIKSGDSLYLLIDPEIKKLLVLNKLIIVEHELDISGTQITNAGNVFINSLKTK